MAQRSLFRTLIDSPWWVSLLAAVPTYALGAMLARLLPGGANPYMMGAAASLPFIGTAVYAAWLRVRRGPPLDTPALLHALRNASPDEMRAMLAEAYQRAGYQAKDAPGGDLELERNGYVTLVRFRRWRAQSTAPAALDELSAAVRARKADHGAYVTAGSVTEATRNRATQGEMTLLDGPALAELVGRTQAARAVLKRANAERGAAK